MKLETVLPLSEKELVCARAQDPELDEICQDYTSLTDELQQLSARGSPAVSHQIAAMEESRDGLLQEIHARLKTIPFSYLQQENKDVLR